MVKATEEQNFKGAHEDEEGAGRPLGLVGILGGFPPSLCLLIHLTGRLPLPCHPTKITQERLTLQDLRQPQTSPKNTAKQFRKRQERQKTRTKCERERAHLVSSLLDAAAFDLPPLMATLQRNAVDQVRNQKKRVAKGENRSFLLP